MTLNHFVTHTASCIHLDYYGHTRAFLGSQKNHSRGKIKHKDNCVNENESLYQNMSISHSGKDHCNFIVTIKVTNSTSSTELWLFVYLLNRTALLWSTAYGGLVVAVASICSTYKHQAPYPN